MEWRIWKRPPEWKKISLYAVVILVSLDSTGDANIEMVLSFILTSFTSPNLPFEKKSWLIMIS